jgi:FtsZ-binding cell division protein ZapB
MFSQESKLAVLESKLNIYEDLSREMLSKLEAAVDKISEGNNRIATILAKHDERIDQSIKSDGLIIKMIEDMKEENKEDHARVRNRIEKLETVVEDLKKFKWQMGGIAAIAVVIVGILPHFIDRILPSQYNGSTQIQNTTR